MNKPFAVVVPENSVADAEGFSVVIEGEECCPSWGNWLREGADSFATRVNAAVSALVAAARKEEREAMKERCAKACDERGRLLRMNGMIFRAEEADALAAAIRALGE